MPLGDSENLSTLSIYIIYLSIYLSTELLTSQALFLANSVRLVKFPNNFQSYWEETGRVMSKA